jgi:hypothetical protein
MIVHNVEQGTPEWMRVRLGIPTASRINDVLTPKTMKPAAAGAKYRNQLLAEWVLGYPVDWGDAGGWAERGRDMEAEARAWYEMERDTEVERVGFITRADGMFGGSPDGLLGTDGGIEIKCPAMHTHVGYLLDPQSLVDHYRGQVQSYLYLTGRAWWDLVAYNPDLPAVERRIEPELAYQQAMDAALHGFIADMEAAREVLAPYRAPAMSVAA